MQLHKEFVVSAFDGNTGEVDFTTREFMDNEVLEYDASLAIWGALLLPELKGKDVKVGMPVAIDVNLLEAR